MPNLSRKRRFCPMKLLQIPINIYGKIKQGRDWLLDKIEYLQGESAKWRTAFNIVKSPYSLLRACGLSPQMAVGLLFSGSTVGTGVVVNETVFAERSFGRGDSGVYNAPLDAPIRYEEGSNTLRIDLGTTPVREITIENVSVGTVFANSAIPAGQTTAVLVGGKPTAEGFTATKLEIGTLIFEKSRCQQLLLSNINAHTLTIRGNASDGQSIAPSPGTSRMLAVGGGHHQADAMRTSGGMYDRIWIQAPSSGINGRIGTLKLSNLYTKGAPCELTNIEVGTMEIILNEVGSGDGLAAKDLVIATTVTAANLVIEDNIELLIAQPATINP